VVQKVVHVEGLAELLDTTTHAIRSHLQRRNFSAIPKPIRLGDRIVWTMKKVDEFLDGKEKEAEASFETDLRQLKRAGRGRPTKKQLFK